MVVLPLPEVQRQSQKALARERRAAMPEMLLVLAR
jgi:hypothetical protein